VRFETKVESSSALRHGAPGSGSQKKEINRICARKHNGRGRQFHVNPKRIVGRLAAEFLVSASNHAGVIHCQLRVKVVHRLRILKSDGSKERPAGGVSSPVPGCVIQHPIEDARERMTTGWWFSRPRHNATPLAERRNRSKGHDAECAARKYRKVAAWWG
jgi:hypothetical protein